MPCRDAGCTTSYTWDDENRLASVTLPNSGGTVSFTYDPLGRRIRKVFGNATTIYAYDGNDVLEIVDAGGSVSGRYTHGQGFDDPLVQLVGTVSRFYMADGLGSTTSLTDSAGSIVASYVFDSFGGTVTATGSAVQPYRFGAREQDSETGLYFLRARYYETGTGRFLNEDLGALAVIDNTHAIPPRDLQAGDALMTRYPGGQLGHTRVVTDSVCTGNCSDPTVTWYQGNLPPVRPFPLTKPLSTVSGGTLNSTQIPRRWNFGKW